MSIDEIQLWDRGEEEPSLWFDRFERFRLAGPRRSLLATYNAERAGDPEHAGEPPAKDIAGSWKDAAKRYDWRNRASTWDAYEAQRRREEFDQEREEDKAARIMLLKVARSKLVEALGSMHVASMRPGEIMNGVKIVSQELRAEYDDLPTQPLALETMTDDELRAIATGASRR